MTQPRETKPEWTIPYRTRPDHRVVSVSQLQLLRPQQSGTGIVIIDGYLDVTEITESVITTGADGSWSARNQERIVREKAVTLYLPESALRVFVAGVLRDNRKPSHPDCVDVGDRP